MKLGKARIRNNFLYSNERKRKTKAHLEIDLKELSYFNLSLILWKVFPAYSYVDFFSFRFVNLPYENFPKCFGDNFPLL